MSHYLGLCVSFKGKNDFSNLVSVQQLGTLVGRRRIATNLGISIKYHADACGLTTRPILCRNLGHFTPVRTNLDGVKWVLVCDELCCQWRQLKL